jgi:hypothetical protein
MVTLATCANEWGRASYLDLEGGPRTPQAIGTLLPQVLARYALSVNELPQGDPPQVECEAAQIEWRG